MHEVVQSRGGDMRGFKSAEGMAVNCCYFLTFKIYWTVDDG